jgi:hypothetical protein
MWWQVLLAVASSAGAARAEELPLDAYRLAWVRGDGAETCPGEAELEARVTARLGRRPFSESAPRVIEGTVSREGDAWHATLRVRDAHGALVGGREFDLEGPDCGAISAATTLAVVLTIDPNAPVLAGEIPTASFPVAAVIPTARPPAAATDAVPPVAPGSRAEAVTCPQCQPAKPGVRMDAAAVVAAGVLPSVAFGAALDALVPAGPGALLFGARFLPDVNTSDGHLGLSLVTAELGYCGGWALGPTELDVCGAVEAGAVRALARDLTPVDPGNYPWVAMHAGPRWVVPARSGAAVELGVFALVPFTRQVFHVDSADATTFQTSAVSVLATVGIRLGGR